MARTLTVVQLLPALESGGVERSTLEISQALVAGGHRALVVSAGGRLVPRLQAMGAEHIALDVGRKSLATVGYVPVLQRLLRDQAVDVVHARSRLPAWLGWLALRTMPAARRPHWMTTVHGLNSPSRYSAIMTSGQRVVCVSHTVRDYVLRHYPDTPRQRLVVIERGIDPAAFPATPDRAGARAAVAMQHPALAGNGPLLLLPGRGTRLKGHIDALHLLAGIRRTGADARLWMPGARQAGRDAYLTQLHTLAGQLGVQQAVVISPPLDAMPQAYAASDLVLQLSRKPESFGRTVVEALAIGRPVLGWAHGGVGEVLARLQPDGAVPPFAADALLARAGALLTHPPPAPATIPYTLQAMQQATLAVYRTLVAT